MTPPTDRIASLDALRGLGVLGILAVNAPVFSQPFALLLDPALLGPLDPDSAKVWAVVHIAFERKFVTLFSMLFGASLLLVGGNGEDPVQERVLFRRLGWLAVFGVIHGALVWYGDILLCYAIAGFAAASCRGWCSRRLLVAGALVFGVGALLECYEYWGAGKPSEIPFATADAAALEIRAFSGSFAESLRENVRHWLAMTQAMPSFIPSTLGLMLLGMGLFKADILTGRRSAAFYLGLLSAGTVCLALLAGATVRDVSAGFTAPEDTAWRESINALLCPVMTLGYVGAICLWLKSPLRCLTAPLAATGRMAFTNYLTQSLIMTAIFYGGRGPGLFWQVTLAQDVPLVIGIWLVQLVWSPTWLSAFQYGPFEWIWRSLSFARPATLWRRHGLR